MDFSVLMTTYNGETPENLDASLNSILIEQTVIPNQLVLVLDGPISDELKAVIDKYKQQFSDIVDVVDCPINQGQSKASAEGMKHIKYDLVARMDSDDICVKNRFELQLKVFEQNPNLSVVGGWIEEFNENPGDLQSLRIVPEDHDSITKMFRNRTPINNVTAMIKKDAIENAGGYGRPTVNEDYSLYAHMWVNNETFYNIQSVLVNVRVGNGMVSRRSDFKIFKDWCEDQKYLYKNKKHSFFVSLFSCIKCFIFVITPVKLKDFLYKKFLRKGKKDDKKGV